MKHTNLIILFVLFCSIPFVGWSQQNIISPSKQVSSSFAIFADDKTFAVCENEIKAYKDALEDEGLAVFVLSANWESPEHVKYFLKKYYNEQALEGAVFIGEIPIPMIRGAQHLTSAFKMDEKRYPMDQSSVPSDRFYDDFDLVFNFISKDSLKPLFYYYNLSGNSPQIITSDIYTGRIKATEPGEKGYEQIRKYLIKAVAQKKENNPLDVVCSYTGEGSFSNSLTSWKDEQVTLKEQMPAAFTKADDAKFYIFFMQPYMKDVMIKELKRDDVDLMIFHEHGLPHRQYLTGIPPAVGEDEAFESAKLFFREKLRRAVAQGKDTVAFKEDYKKRFGINDKWFAGAMSKQMLEADSIRDIKQGIVLEDVKQINPNPKMVIFDACYNGDFREDSFIAGEYILADGETIVCWANSVNVLQDKSSSDLMGILACGARVGEWARNVNILESHLIGDPTFCFATPAKFPKIRYRSKDINYWMAVMGHNLPYDLKGLALHKLHQLGYEKLPALLRDVYFNTPSYMLRLQVMHIAAYYGGDLYADILKASATDPYEFIRRKGAYYMGKVGRNDFIPYLTDMYLNDYLAERVIFNVLTSSDHVNTTMFRNSLKDKVSKSHIFDKDTFIKDAELKIASKERLRDSFWADILDKNQSTSNRKMAISYLRNNPFSQIADDLILVISDKTEPEDIRIQVAEALGWYTRSVRNVHIIHSLQKILASDKDMSDELKNEISKTINRLKPYAGGGNN